MDKAQEQFCDYCGESQGHFQYSRRFEGPLICGKPECNRWAVEEERAQLDERREAAERDDYGRY